MGDLTVPDEFHGWPFDARKYVLAEANTAVDLRLEIDSLVGLNGDEWKSDQALNLTKNEAAAIVMALGGPQGDHEA